MLYLKEFKELYDIGIDLDEYMKSGDNAIRESMIDKCKNIYINGRRTRAIEAVSKKVHMLIFADMNCPDCAVVLPIIEKMRSLNQNIAYKIVKMIDYKDKMNDIFGEAKVPTIVIMDEQFRMIGLYIEFTKNLRNLQRTMDKDMFKKVVARFRTGEFDKYVVDDILTCISISI